MKPGIFLLQVKWKSYEDLSNITWEPEDVLRYADPITTSSRCGRPADILSSVGAISHRLDVYFAERGGREKVLINLREKRKANGGKGCVRDRGWVLVVWCVSETKGEKENSKQAY